MYVSLLTVLFFVLSIKSFNFTAFLILIVDLTYHLIIKILFFLKGMSSIFTLCFLYLSLICSKICQIISLVMSWWNIKVNIEIITLDWTMNMRVTYQSGLLPSYLKLSIIFNFKLFLWFCPISFYKNRYNFILILFYIITLFFLIYLRNLIFYFIYYQVFTF